MNALQLILLAEKACPVECKVRLAAINGLDLEVVWQFKLNTDEPAHVATWIRSDDLTNDGRINYHINSACRHIKQRVKENNSCNRNINPPSKGTVRCPQ